VLTANVMTINLQGAFHTLYNSEYQGAIPLANAFFSYVGDIIANELNQAFSGSQIGAVRQAIARRTQAIQECQKKCNIPKRY